jgi:hypothetical protein
MVTTGQPASQPGYNAFDNLVCLAAVIPNITHQSGELADMLRSQANLEGNGY